MSRSSSTKQTSVWWTLFAAVIALIFVPSARAQQGATEIPGMGPIVAQARFDLENLIRSNSRLAAKFLRLAFHDCVGGCDGCVDMTDPDNAGLDLPINALAPLVARYESRGISRTDLWMMAAIVAADMSQPSGGVRLEFPIMWLGRQTCEQLNNNNCGNNFLGQPTTCTATTGPFRPLVHGMAGSMSVLEFFQNEFRFTPQQVTALMGAHSIGFLTRRNSGFEGAWDLTPQQLDNGYYIELVGQQQQFGAAATPDWQQVTKNNVDLGMPNTIQWEAPVGGTRLTMLNPDVSLVRQIDDNAVPCSFLQKGGTTRCPDAPSTLPHVVRYSQNSNVFLEDFRDVLYRLIVHGYRRPAHCLGFNAVCQLLTVPV